MLVVDRIELHLVDQVQYVWKFEGQNTLIL